MSAINSALHYVQGMHPEVTNVLFLPQGYWMFMDDYGAMPVFHEGIDTTIFEDALDEAYENHRLPCAFSIDDPRLIG